jgi:hypothetical protein
MEETLPSQWQMTVKPSVKGPNFSDLVSTKESYDETLTNYKFDEIVFFRRW